MKDKEIMNREKMDKNMINKKDGVNSKNKLLEEVKDKLRWYATEASEEEFDEEEVNILVNLVNKLEPQPILEQQELEQEMERFRAYVNLYMEDEERRKNVENVVEKASAEKATEENVGEKPGKIIAKPKRFRGKRLAIVAAAACILLVIIIGGFGDTVNADEDTGFFHWLKRDEEGILAITSPDKNKVGMEEVDMKEYASIEELPEEYHQYVIEQDDISLLQEYELQSCIRAESKMLHKITEIFTCPQEKKEIKLEVIIYQDENIILKEKYEDYKFLYKNIIGEQQQDVFMKEEKTGEIKYVVLFYKDNKKYLVSGSQDVEFLEAVSEEYMNLIFN